MSTTSRRAWIGLAVLALPTLLLSLNMSVLYLALPDPAQPRRVRDLASARLPRRSRKTGWRKKLA